MLKNQTKKKSIIAKKNLKNYFRSEAKTSVLERAFKTFCTNINVKVKIIALFLLQLHEKFTDGINNKKGWLYLKMIKNDNTFQFTFLDLHLTDISQILRG